MLDVKGIATLERLFRVAAELDVDKDDLKRYTDFINQKILRAWGDPTTGKVFCLSEGPSKEAVSRVHERAGHKPDEIYEVPLEVG